MLYASRPFNLSVTYRLFFVREKVVTTVDAALDLFNDHAAVLKRIVDYAKKTSGVQLPSAGQGGPHRGYHSSDHRGVGG
jgi:hypothetical protein